MLELAPEQKTADIKERCDAAENEIKPILAKYQVQFAARLIPTESALLAVPCLKDTKYEPIPSPIQV
jgi:hypothetical protein